MNPLILALFAGEAYNMHKSEKNLKEAEKINLKAMNKLANAEKHMSDMQDNANASVLKLVNVKKGCVAILNKFVELYRQIAKINFKDNIFEQEFLIPTLEEENMREIQSISLTSEMKLNDKQTVALFIMKGLFASDKKETEYKIKAAQANMKIARGKEEQCKTLEIIFDGVKNKCDAFSDVLQKINILFVKAIMNTKTIIEKNGYDCSNYTREEAICIGGCINIAGVITELVRTPVFNENGELADEIQTAIFVGNRYLEEINNV